MRPQFKEYVPDQPDPAVETTRLTPRQREAAEQLFIDFWTFASQEQTQRQLHLSNFLVTSGTPALDEWTDEELIVVLLHLYGADMTVPELIGKLDLTAEHIASQPSGKLAAVNKMVAGAIQQAVDGFLAAQTAIDELPESERRGLVVTRDDIDSLFGVLQPLHAKV